MLDVPARELVLEAPAIELIRRDGRERGIPPFDALRDVAVVAGGKEKAKSRLEQLVLLDVVLHVADAREVVGADLYGGLADLERRLGRWSGPLLGDEDRCLGSLALELERERQAREPAPQDRDVVAVTCGFHRVLLGESKMRPPAKQAIQQPAGGCQSARFGGAWNTRNAECSRGLQISFIAGAGRL